MPGAPYRGMLMTDPTSMIRNVTQMVEMVQQLGPEAFITFSASGRASICLTGLGTFLGHHVRPGMGETNWRHPHTESAIERNEHAIRDAVDVARGLGREPATPAELRAMMT